ncbi:MAG: hypothetical protein U0Q12_22950 [Vicinamibacterales bacterium]
MFGDTTFATPCQVPGVARRSARHLVFVIGLLALAPSLGARAADVDPSLLGGLAWRSIGPYRGGRVTAVAGVVGQSQVYYMGSTGGGVWKTEDAGITWRNVTDGFVKTGSVGAIAVAPSDPNVVYVGMGEACLRANLSSGDGLYKSTDAGRTWTHIGLPDSRQIGRIRVHPTDPSLVYVAAVGHPFGPNQERGLFRSRDGGRTWQRVLFVNDRTGAVDVDLDAKHPSTIYATTWQVLREPWGITAGGPGSDVYKSVDGGDTWTRLTVGLPAGDKERIGVSVSPADSNRVYVTLEASEGGVYKSDDAGATWQHMNDSIDVRSRSYYYAHIFADPIERDTVYVFSAKSFYRSKDGGRTLEVVRAPHGDFHDLWIDPHDNRRMVNGNDGGACITFNGGESWSTLDNQPTGQFYVVATDNAVPYRIYGSQQDNTTVSIPSRTSGPGITATDWYPVGGGESGYLAPHPAVPEVSFGGSYWGLITRYDHRTREVRNVTVWPDYPGGRQAADMRYRFQWTFPIIMSRHAPHALYAGANVVFKSLDEGQSWTVISPDLTRNDKDKERGGRLEEFYSTVFTLAESPRQRGVIWAGSDDGLVQVTRDDGATWTNVTPPDLQPYTRVNIIDASPHDAAAAYVAANRYQLDDDRPFIYRTTDYGRTWSLIVQGLPPRTFVRTVREDPKRRGLLYAGTETGVFVSFDAGDRWQSLQLNLPVVPITDLTVKNDDLVASTQGRGFWILDDLTTLHQVDAADTTRAVRVFRPRDTARSRGAFGRAAGAMGQNPPVGVVVRYFLAATPSDAVTLEFLDAQDRVVQRFSSADRGRTAVPAAKGVNRFEWDMRYPDAQGIDKGTYLFGGNLRGPVALPGEYRVRLTAGGDTQTMPFTITPNPQSPATADDLARQFEFLMALRDRVSRVHGTINEINALEAAVGQAVDGAKAVDRGGRIAEAGAKLRARVLEVRHELWEPRFTGFDDQTLLYDLKLNNRIAALQGYVQGADRAPTDQVLAVSAELSKAFDESAGAWTRILDVDLPAFNSLLRARGRPVVERPQGR